MDITLHFRPLAALAVIALGLGTSYASNT